MNSTNTHVDIDSMLREPGHECLKAALYYASRSWKIHPCKPGEKRALLKGWPEKATTNGDIIRSWWGKHPNANIGVVCGADSDLLVVDCDIDKETGEPIGEQNFRAACANIGFGLDSVPSARTPSGGRHFFFRCPPGGLKNSVNKGIPGCDIRCENGYVLVAPSMTEKGQYRWETDTKPQPMPPELVDIFRGAPEKAPTTSSPADHTRRTTRPRARGREGDAYIEGGIQGCVAAVANALEGARNDTLNSEALRAFRLALANPGLHLDDVAADLHAAARSTGLDDIEASRTIASAMKAAKEKGPADIPEKEKPGRRTSSRPQRPPEMDADAAEDLAELDALLAAAEDGHTGPAQMFVEKFRDKYLYDTSDGRWYIFEDGCWKQDRLGDVAEDVKTIRNAFAWGAEKCAQLASAQPVNKEAQDYWKASEESLRKARKALTLNHNIKAVVEIAGTGSGNLTYDGRGWDTESHALPCANGVVRFRTEDGCMMEHSPGRPSDRFLKRSRIRYNKIATCKTFRRTLAEIFSEEHLPEQDREMCGFFRRLIGYSVLRSPTEQIFCFLNGRGSNGKSLIMEILDYVLGPIAGNVKKEVFLSVRDKDANAPSPSNFAFRGVGPCFCRELDGSKPFDIGLVKAITGGDPIIGRHLFARDEIKFNPTHTLMIATNELPRLPAMDEATWRRVLVIPFRRAFKDEPDQSKGELQKDKELPAKLKTEAEGILAWIVEGACEYIRRGNLGIPATVYEETASYREGVDDVAQFIEDCCVVSVSATAGAEELYAAYKTWCQESGIRSQMTRPKFKADLLKRGFKRPDGSTRGARRYMGIGLLES